MLFAISENSTDSRGRRMPDAPTALVRTISLKAPAMSNHSVYRIDSDYVTYLVLAPSEEAAVRCLWETEGTSEEEWRETNDDISVGVISPDKLDTLFMHEDGNEDEGSGPLKAISAVVAEMKLGAEESEVICSTEYY